ncbi:MAG: hypothetical protein WBG69_07020 [Arcobacteraceae bacterium]
MIKNTNLLTKTLVALSVGAILSGCATGIHSTTITAKKDLNKGGYNLLKNTSRWFVIDTTSANYEKWKTEQFINKYGNSNLSNLSIINDCFKGTILGTYEGRRSVALRKFDECVPKTNRVGESIIVNFNEDGIIGELNVTPKSSHMVTKYYYENYEYNFLALIESDDKADLSSLTGLRWYSPYTSTRWKERSIDRLKEIRASLDKYEIRYTYPKVESTLLSDITWYRYMQSKIAE